MIRKATKHDLDAIWNVIKAGSEWLVSEHNAHHWIDWYTPKVVADKLEHTEVYMYEIASEVVGVYSLSAKLPSYFNDYSFTYTAKPHTITLGMLGVSPSYQSQGIGRQLVNHAEQKAAEMGFAYMLFDTNSKVAPIVGFYEKLGYEVVAELLDEEDKYLVFEKKLQMT